MKRAGIVTVWIAGIAVAGFGFAATRSQSASALVGFSQSSLPAVTASAAIPPAASDAADLNLFVRLARRAVPSVVNIQTMTIVKASFQGDSGAEDLFRQFFENGMPFGTAPPFRFQPHNPAARRAAALGTGFVVDPSGIIMTNNHVVAGADEILVQFTENPDEKPVKGKVIGRDPELDIALVKVETSRKLEALSLGDSDALEVGEYVMAIGNPYGNGHSVTHGIVSAKGRNAPGAGFSNWLQINAPINPGNSGGPLLNTRGEVVGVNSAIDARAQGIGFAIPINSIKQILVQLKTNGKVRRGYIGAVVGPLTPAIAAKIGAPADLHAAFVTQVNPGSPAEKAGLQPYDVITAVNQAPIHSPDNLVRAITSLGVGERVPLTVLRAGKELRLTMKTDLRPTNLFASNSGDEGTPDKDDSSKSGVAVGKATEGPGVVVSQVEPGSAADSAGLRPGDRILEVDRKAVKSPEEFRKLLAHDKSYLLRIERDDPSDGQPAYAVIVLDDSKNDDNG